MFGDVGNLVEKEVSAHPLLDEAKEVLWGEAGHLASVVEDAEAWPIISHTSAPQHTSTIKTERQAPPPPSPTWNRVLRFPLLSKTDTVCSLVDPGLLFNPPQLSHLFSSLPHLRAFHRFTRIFHLYYFPLPLSSFSFYIVTCSLVHIFSA